MEKIKIFDTTLRDGEQSPGCSMTIENKVELAHKLDVMNVDIIEAGFAASSKRDFIAIERISKIVKNSIVASLARCNKDDIDLSYEAIKCAKKKRIHVFIATSDIHMKYKLKKSKDEVKKIVSEMVGYAKSKCDDIEFSLEDATRTNKDFAVEIIDIAIKSGATTINIPDTVGYIVPFEYMDFIKYIKNNSKYINNVDLSVHCHNDLGMALINTLSGIKVGATQVECTINGIGERAGNAALEEVVAALSARSDYFLKQTNIDKQKIYETSLFVQNITGSYVQNNKPIVGINAFRHESGIHQAGVINNRKTYEILNPQDYGIYVDNIVIGIHSGKNAIINKMQKLGFDISKYNIDSILSDIKEYCTVNSDIKEQAIINIINNNKIYNKVKKIL